MVSGIETHILLRLCRAWEMNNGVDGFEEFTGMTQDTAKTMGADALQDWVTERSFHKSVIRYGLFLLEWLDKKGP